MGGGGGVKREEQDAIFIDAPFGLVPRDTKPGRRLYSTTRGKWQAPKLQPRSFLELAHLRNNSRLLGSFWSLQSNVNI
jgi:hypothetical protein